MCPLNSLPSQSDPNYRPAITPLHSSLLPILALAMFRAIISSIPPTRPTFQRLSTVNIIMASVKDALPLSPNNHPFPNFEVISLNHPPPCCQTVPYVLAGHRGTSQGWRSEPGASCWQLPAHWRHGSGIGPSLSTPAVVSRSQTFCTGSRPLSGQNRSV